MIATFLMIVHWKRGLASSINVCISELNYFSRHLHGFGFVAFAVSVALIQNNINFTRGRHV